MYYTSAVRPRPLLLVLLGLLLVTSYLFIDAPQVRNISYILYDTPTIISEPSSLLLVSAFFPLAKSKHSNEEYAIWLSRFLKPVSTHIYFFTTPEMVDTIRELRGDLPITINSSFVSPFAIPPLLGLEDDYKRMHELDSEKDIHSPELYAVWSSKAYFLDEGMKNMQAEGHNYDYAFWNDAGSFRDKQEFSSWPDGWRISGIWEQGAWLTGTPKEDLFFMPIWDAPNNALKNWEEPIGPVETGNSFSEGSFFGGSQKAVTWWRQVFYAYHDYYIFKRHVFAGKDQTIFNSIFLLFPDRFITVWQFDTRAPNYIGITEGPLGSCGETWWYYQFFVASGEEQDRMRNIWNPPVRDWTYKQVNKDKACRLTRLLPMRDVFKYKFGRFWRHPKPTIDINVSQRS